MNRLSQAGIAARLRLELRRRARYDRLDAEGQAAWRGRRLADLRHHAVARSPWYRDLHRGLEGAPLADLPVVTKDDVVDRFDRLVTDRSLGADALRRRVDGGSPGPADSYRVAASSGSSGRPGLFPFDLGEWIQLLAAAARARAVPGPVGTPGPGRVRAARIGSPSPWHLSTQLPATLADPRRPTLELSAATDVTELCARLGEWQPHVLTGYPSVLGALAAEQIAGRLAIAPARVFTGAERLAPGVRTLISQAWGNPPFDQYVTTEAGFVAIECDRHAGMHVLEDHVVVEIVDGDGRPVAPDAEGGRVLITVLGSRTLPLIRYELGDVASFADGPCACGRRSPRIRSVAGAGRTLLQLPGREGGLVAVHPVVFTAVLDHSPVRAWQVVRHPDRIEALLVDPAPGFDGGRLRTDLRAALEAAGAARLPVEVTPVDELRRAPSGKAGLVVTAVDDPA